VHKFLRSVFIVLIFVSPVIGQDIAQCRADLKAWMPMFKATYDAPECRGDGTVASPFAAPVKDLTSGRLTSIVYEMDSCAKLDTEGDHYLYQRVATRAENILVMRTGYFLKETGQADAYAKWESERLETSHPETDEDLQARK
jgi:hypothetical protein